MTTLEIILSVILWIVFGVFLLAKWKKADSTMPEAAMVFMFCFTPLVFLGAIIRQVFFEDWK